jgi:histidinol dehydrogenase
MNMSVRRRRELSEDERARLLSRSEGDIEQAMTVVQPIVKAVKQRGDDAVTEYTKKLDNADLTKLGLVVSENEIEAAGEALDVRVRNALDYAISNVRRFHRRQLPKGLDVEEVAPGIRAGERMNPIPSVGLYVPRGRGSFPSMLYMLAVPAQLAGVPSVAVATPPDRDGTIDPACLYAASSCGVSTIYRTGGAQAIAAMAYGTESVRKVDKIVGPGSAFVAAAKRLVSHIVDVGLPAGPSESIVLADEHASAETVALDLMIEAEHGSDSSALLVTPSEALATAVAARVDDLIDNVPESRRRFLLDVFEGYGGVLLVESMDEAVEFVNDYAPEHLQIQAADPHALATRITNAGEILLGKHTPFSVANYATGPNAVLPTGGNAKAWSPVSVREFMKSTSMVEVTEEGLSALSTHTVALAEYEGFFSHAEALRRRMS